jgi:hypothetical protein
MTFFAGSPAFCYFAAAERFKTTADQILFI